MTEENKKEDLFDQNLSDIDLDALGEIDFSKIKISEDDVKEVLNDDSVDLAPKSLKPQYLPTEQPTKNTAAVKEKNHMTNIKKALDSLGASDESDESEQIRNVFEGFGNEDISQYKIQVHRLEPQLLKGMKIAGYLETYYLPITIPDIIERVGRTYGGGRYKLQIVDASGKYIKSKIFEIAGFPKIPTSTEEKKEEPEQPQQQSQPQNFASLLGNKPKKDEYEDDLLAGDDDSLEDDSDDHAGFFNKKSHLRPRPGFGHGHNPYGGFGGGFNSGGFGFRRNEEDEIEKTKRDLETKIDSKFEKINEKLNAMTNRKDSNSLLSPELLQAAMPLIGTFMESRSSKDNMLAQQFSEMNSRMMSLFQGLQDMTRMNEKSRDDILEKERREREAARKEWLDTQAKLEEKYREQTEKQENRFREMMQAMQQTLEKRHSDETSAQRAIREEYERQREETRRKQEEFYEKMRQKEEEARIKMEDVREQARRAEIEKDRESRKQELEIIEKMRALELEKLQYQQEQLRKNFADNIGTKEYEYKMQLALGNVTKERDSQLQELKAQMEIEKLRNDAKLELARIKQESEDKKTSDDAFDKIMADYLRRRLQIMMMRDLEGVEADSEDDSPVTPGKVFNNVLSRGSEALGVILQQILKGPGLEDPSISTSRSRVIEPKQSPRVNPAAKPTSQKSESQTEPVSTESTESTESENLENSAGVDLSSLSAFGPELMQEIEKIRNYFGYLKEAIQSNADPKEAAEIGKQQLLPPIVDYLGTLQDSRVVIQELQGLLDDQETVEFFLQENSIKWLDTLLTYFKN